MTKGAALHEFFSRFGIAAYPSSSVDEDAAMPYLTYDPVFNSWGNGQVSISVSLWYRTEGEAVVNAKAQEISDIIGGGKYLVCDGGAILITRGSPWCQSLVYESDTKIKRRVINVTAEYLTLN